MKDTIRHERSRQRLPSHRPQKSAPAAVCRFHNGCGRKTSHCVPRLHNRILGYALKTIQADGVDDRSPTVMAPITIRRSFANRTPVCRHADRTSTIQGAGARLCFQETTTGGSSLQNLRFDCRIKANAPSSQLSHHADNHSGHSSTFHVNRLHRRICWL